MCNERLDLMNMSWFFYQYQLAIVHDISTSLVVQGTLGGVAFRVPHQRYAHS